MMIPTPFYPQHYGYNEDIYVAERIRRKMAIAGTTLFLAFAMLNLCLALAALKRGNYLRRKLRTYLGSFSVPLGIFFVVAMDLIFFQRFNLDKLDVPPSDQVNVSLWINPPNFSKLTDYGSGSAGLVHGLSFAISIALTLIIFTEVSLNGITALKNKASKPGIFMADYAITMILFPILSGCLGWPFMSGATVRTMSHLSGLVVMDRKPPPGMPQRIIGTIEQRLSTLIVGVLVALSVFIGSALRFIPMAALYGMFLYMGVMGLRDLTFVKRCMILMKRRKHWKVSSMLTHFISPERIYI
ncbi:unnamed protein product [Protopolystoma xenopodis]|uniref:Bicarbonate transporter-like transmembrane domain-containing protein n=1 Tax=Protopolystoma xenopodis TaxID=117903 RepID=A0A3S5AUM5_9PLAT|nr:unnamed protein product [Protopolystoma xenopodis]